MEDWLHLLASFLSAVFGGLITIWLCKKYMFSAQNMEESLEKLTGIITTNENLQKKLYYIGAILGQGVKQGIGLSNSKGKFRWEDLAAQILPNIIGQLFPATQAQTGEAAKMPWE